MKLDYMTIINFGGDPYSSNKLLKLDMQYGNKIVYDIEVDWKRKYLFPNLSMCEGENNRIVDISFDDVLRSVEWDFDFNWDDLIEMLTYKDKHGISFMGIICPICKETILEDAVILVDEDTTYFCDSCNILLKLKSDKGE